MAIAIRNADRNDVPVILEIVNHAIAHTTTNYNYEPDKLEERLAWFEKKQLQSEPVLVITVAEKIQGFATYGSFREKYGYRFTAEHSVYVSPGNEGKGLGTLLMQELIAKARENGLHSLIGGIDAENTDSIRFHEKFGFRECGRIPQAAFKFGRWLDLVFMQLILE